jgi:hypothetical protein
MDSDKLQQSQDENKRPLPQIDEDESTESQEVEQENLKPEILPQGCAFVRPCPTTGSPIGCVVCT